MKLGKKRGVVLFLFSLIVLNFVFVSAQYSYFDSFLNSPSMYSSRQVIGAIIGDVYSGEVLFVKLLVFFLVLALVHFSLGRMGMFEAQNGVKAIISIIVALLGVRFMTTDQLINFIWLPYGVLAIALSSLLPFIIFFFFIESFDSELIRRVGWVLIGVIYAFLASTRWHDTGMYFGSAWWQNYSMIYLMTALVCLLIFIFERGIRRRIMLSSIKRGYDTKSIMLKSDLQRELVRINDALANPAINGRDAARLKDEKKRVMLAINRIS